MVKTPEEYFAEQNFDTPSANSSNKELSNAEKAFVDKYLGSDSIEKLPSINPEGEQFGNATQQGRLSWAELKVELKQSPLIQMFSFYVKKQIFLLPIIIIQEVLRYIPVIRLPLAPPFVAGVVNLRGRVTPLVHLDALLTLEQRYRYTEKSFIIICSTDQMQLGLIIDQVNTMHMLDQKKLTWSAEQLGDSADFLCGVADINDRICGILAPDMITQKLLNV